MFDEEFEEAIESWLLNIKHNFQVYRYDDNLREPLSLFSDEQKIYSAVEGG